MKRIIQYIRWKIDERRREKIIEKRKLTLVNPKSKLEELRKLKKEIEELEKEWEQIPPHSHNPKDDIVL